MGNEVGSGVGEVTKMLNTDLPQGTCRLIRESDLAMLNTNYYTPVLTYHI